MNNQWISDAELIREVNARQMRRGDAVAGLLLALILGIAGAVALVHWWSA